MKYVFYLMNNNFFYDEIENAFESKFRKKPSLLSKNDDNIFNKMVHVN